MTTKLPPRLCVVSSHAAERYRERFENIVSAKAALRHLLNEAKPCSRKMLKSIGRNGWSGGGLQKRRRSFWISGNVVLVTEWTGKKLIVVTCFPVKEEPSHA